MTQYTVKAGDTLWGIAQQYLGAGHKWKELGGYTGAPENLPIGTVLTIPGETPAQTIEPAPELKIPETKSPIEPAQHILDTVTPESRLAQMEADRQRQMEEWQTRQEELMKDQRAKAGEAAKVMEERKVTPVLEEQMEKFKVDETLEQERQALGQALELQRRAIMMVEQRDAAIAALGQQAIATPFISGQQARIAESYDRRIASTAALAGAQSAYAQALQGNISQARALIGDVVNAYTYDTQLELGKIEMFMDLNREEIGMLDKSYQNALKESQRYWENQLAEEKAEKEAIMNLMIQYPQSGVGLEDSIEDAVRKTSQWLGIQPDQDVKSLITQRPEAFIGMTQEQMDKMTFAEAINKIAGWIGTQEATGVAPTGMITEDMLKQYFSPDQLRDIRRAGIDPTTPEGFQRALTHIAPGPRIPTLYGVTSEVAQDILTSPTPPGWFAEQIEPYFWEPHPHLKMSVKKETDIQQMWDKYKEETITQHKEMRELLGPEQAFLQILQRLGG